ncbi:transcriptional repressor AgaR [Jeongeupia chitinilytica]|uniref:DeoR family transcriptional regulator n=1 Tax=Jeongeupia chitinilytica TaxID=1041641 RepID=A0ABQ3H5C0_9NEIS|nr:transcriptional repressor AgaR [Jeongeupia chitinilytica]GHD65849.1 DeoR family transcriptional regulator [Jeongeupia chitinilytica]
MDRVQERRNRIVQLMREQESCNVSDLADALGVSTVTIRGDLDFLEDSGCISRSYGKAVLSPHFAFELDFREKEKTRSEAKQLIGRAAAQLVGDGDALIIDSGSTVGFVPRYVEAHKRCTLMTNALNLANELIGDVRFELMMTGGTVRADSYSLCGPIAEQAVRLHHFDTLFIGADGIDLKAGVTTTNEQDAQLNRAMIKAADKVVLLADSSKFGRRGFCVICPLPQVHTLITDSGITDEYRRALTLSGVNVIVADE